MKFKLILSALGLLTFLNLFSQQGDWYNLDPVNDGVMGASVSRAYAMMGDPSKLSTVIVAVIDDGVDINHPDFEQKIWLNPREIAENKIDDDNNGYIDDLHGWNFLGNPSGDNVEFETLELTRLLRPLAARFDNVEPKSVSKKDKKDFALYREYKKQFDADVAELNEQFIQFAQLAALFQGASAYMSERTGSNPLSLESLMAYQPADEEESEIIQFLLLAESEGIRDYLDEATDYLEKALKYHYNLEYDPRHMVNEAEARQAGTGYGNAMVWAANPEHGTHVAGIIGAVRGNGIGVDGIAVNALIMPIRAVPGGDERDEDIALAIRYAVDNGAKVVNMSFGKEFSPQAPLVNEAIRYARSKDVLLIHAAGNDSQSNDKVPNYPDGTLGGSKSMDHFITVAASGPVDDASILADFSNWGPKKVDILAPGVDILSLYPEGAVKANSGTSMAAPVVSGVAAVLRGLYPELTAPQIKELIIGSLHYPERGLAATEKGEVPLKKFIKHPGIVNLEKALILAELKHGKR